MDRVVLNRLRVEASVGLLDWEQVQTQILLITCEAQIDVASAAHSDDIAATLDYSMLRSSIQSYCASDRFLLLETLAERLVEHLFVTFPQTNWFRLRVIKPAIFDDADGAGVEIERSRG